MKIKSETEMIEFGQELANKIPKRKTNNATVIELIGDVGAGKTTLVQGLAKALRIKEAITSPSFTISKTYTLPNGGRLIHYDFYRLPKPGLMAEDLTETLTDPHNIVVIEWGESIADILPNDCLKIKILYNNDGTREVKEVKEVTK